MSISSLNTCGKLCGKLVNNLWIRVFGGVSRQQGCCPQATLLAFGVVSRQHPIYTTNNKDNRKPIVVSAFGLCCGKSLEV